MNEKFNDAATQRLFAATMPRFETMLDAVDAHRSGDGSAEAVGEAVAAFIRAAYGLGVEHTAALMVLRMCTAIFRAVAYLPESDRDRIAGAFVRECAASSALSADETAAVEMLRKQLETQLRHASESAK